MISQLYDEIGIGYINHRRPDPRIAELINQALGDADSVVNVGAGAGSYEPDDRLVVAAEPSLEMIRQRPPGSAPSVQANAESLPFRTNSFSAALAILTVHHWQDRIQGLIELSRVTRECIVIVTFDPDKTSKFWLVSDYFPEMAELDFISFPSISLIAEVLGDVDTREIPIPEDCLDGFLGAYWKRPYAYLEKSVRNSISVFAKVKYLESGLTRLKQELDSGVWQEKYGYLMNHKQLDIGYRLVTAKL